MIPRLLVWLGACSSPTSPAPAAPTTWADAVVADPAAFERAMERDGRPGWIALHAGRFDDSLDPSTGFTSEGGQARAAAELERVHRALGRVHRVSAVALAEEWDRQTRAPDVVRAAAEHARDCDPAAGPFGTRVVQDGVVERTIHDPCAEIERARALGLRARTEDVPDLFGPASALLPEPPATDDVQAAREHAADLKRWADARRAAAVDGSPDGRALAEGLLVYDRLAVETAMVAAERALDDGHPMYARTLLLLSQSPSDDGVSPRNPPALYALLAAAELEAGRPREALDALARLEGAVDTKDLLGPRETLGDLTVLRGLPRVGTSAE